MVIFSCTRLKVGKQILAPDLIKKQFPPLGKLCSHTCLPRRRPPLLWLGRAQALVAEVMGLAADSEFKSIMQEFGRYRPWAADEVMRILYRALATVEMELPSQATGAFIPAGNTFDALKA